MKVYVIGLMCECGWGKLVWEWEEVCVEGMKKDGVWDVCVVCGEKKKMEVVMFDEVKEGS